MPTRRSSPTRNRRPDLLLLLSHVDDHLSRRDFERGRLLGSRSFTVGGLAGASPRRHATSLLQSSGSVAELRSIILKARHLAGDHAEQERAAAAVKARLLAHIEKKPRAPSADIADTAPDASFVPERLAA
jgi:hypothetical protein